MIILDLEQGSDAWTAKRREHNTASEAPAMTGKSKNMSRPELVRMKATGVEIEHSSYVKDVVFKNGHRVEELARPFAEEIIGEDLFPIVATDDDGYLFASFDGVTMGEEFIWECKQYNKEKFSLVESGVVPDEDIDQVITQLVVSRAFKCLYMVTDGTKENTVSCWYSLKPGDVTGLLAGWKQLDADVADYQHVEPAIEEVGVSPGMLPALRIGVTGMVTSSNFVKYKKIAIAGIESINTDLVTDKDFANAKETIKWLSGIEKSLVDAKAKALEETQSIDELFRDIGEIEEVARKRRLNLNSTVTVREKARKEEIVMSGKRALAEYIEHKNLALGKPYMPPIIADFPGAVHGLKLMSKREDAVSTELAKAKIQVDMAAEKIQTNLDSLRELAGDHKQLFPDTMAIILKDNDDLVSLIKVRIADHKESEEKRLEEEREKIRLEEQEKLRVASEKEQAEKPAQTGQEPDKGYCAHSDPVLRVDSHPQTSRTETDSDATIDIIRVSLINNGVGSQSAKKIAGLLVGGKVSNVSVVLVTKK